MLRRLLLLTVSLLVVAGAAAAPALADDDPGAPPGTPTATRFGGVPSVGAVFRDGLTQPHSCSASVVLTPRGGLVLTAAHCIEGTGAGLLFAPGYVDGRTPYGVWTVQRAWVSPRWVTSQDPHADYAFLQVAPRTVGHRNVSLQQVTGGAVLGFAPRPGTRVTDIAYPYGIDDEPITCTNTVVSTQGYPTFDCHGYPGGTSGSPFLVRHPGRPDVVVGVIGGLHQGGCFEWNSFSSPFGLDTFATYLRAVTGRPADTVPQAGSDGC
ncbi:trypsin-like serine peptidase [Jatrophihabitans sp. YIM 134969]